MDAPVGANWAGNHTYGATALQEPRDLDELRALVRRGSPLRALGSRHCFNDLADTTGELVSLASFPPALEIDEEARTATFSGGLRYGDLAVMLQDEGWALANLASLPHISVAGAVATGTHGSGDGNGNLATAVSALELVDGTGEHVRLARGDTDFDGAVVSLGALGILTRVTLDVQPTFDVRQDVYTGITWPALLEHLDDVMASAYSVSVFTDWLGESVGGIWLKSRMDAPEPPAELYGATPVVTEKHMIEDMPPVNTTQQGGVPGAWNERLAHFRMEFTPSNGDELQSEFLVPRDRAHEALEAVRDLGEEIAPLLHITELRSVAADQLWLSGCYATPVLAIHFTWKNMPTEVAPVLARIEDRLLPLGARPHWGKVFHADVDTLAALYPRLDDFRRLAERYDPSGLFRNAYLSRRLGLPAP